jgi:succinyl-CoA synthetase beta subunit
MRRKIGRADFGMNIKGITVDKVLVDEAADIKEEIYLGIVIDRTLHKPSLSPRLPGGRY